MVEPFFLPCSCGHMCSRQLFNADLVNSIKREHLHQYWLQAYSNKIIYSLIKLQQQCA